MNYKIRSLSAGFTLIEISIVLIIIGLMASASCAMLMAYSKAKYIEVTRDNMAKVEKAIKSYQILNGAYPCPASRMAQRGDPAFGKTLEQCYDEKADQQPATGFSSNQKATVSVGGRNDGKVRIGIVPFRSLGLSDNDAVDGWGRLFQYAVTEKLTSAEKFDQKSGAIDIVAEDKTSRLIQPGSAQYIVFSTGEDGAGGYSSEGVASGACPAGLLETENCNDDAIFMDAQLQMTPPPTSWRSSRQVVSYDDYVSYQQYDPSLEGGGSLVFLYQNSCMKGFTEVETQGRNAANIEILTKMPAWLNQKEGTDNLKLCVSDHYTVSLLLPTKSNAAEPLPCPVGWNEIGYKLYEKGWSDDENTPASYMNYQVCAK